MSSFQGNHDEFITGVNVFFKLNFPSINGLVHLNCHFFLNSVVISFLFLICRYKVFISCFFIFLLNLKFFLFVFCLHKVFLFFVFKLFFFLFVYVIYVFPLLKERKLFGIGEVYEEYICFKKIPQLEVFHHKGELYIYSTVIVNFFLNPK